MVKRIEPDGRMRVRPLGGAHPWKWGEGPVDLLADDGTAVPAILGFGASHVSAESPLFRVKDGRLALTWDLACVDAKLSRTELAARGVHAGTKVVLERSRKRPRTHRRLRLRPRARRRGGVAVLLEVARALGEAPPARDVYLVFSSMEEIGGGSVLHAAHVLGAGAMVGVEIVPAVAEYGVTNDARPVLVHADATSVYDPGLTRRLAGIAGGWTSRCSTPCSAASAPTRGCPPRGAVPGSAALLGFATENTHGYEVTHLGGLTGCVALIEGLVRAW